MPILLMQSYQNYYPITVTKLMQNLYIFQRTLYLKAEFLRKNIMKIQNQTRLPFMVKVKEWQKFHYQKVKIH